MITTPVTYAFNYSHTDDVLRQYIFHAMAESGIAAFECGHFATEEPGIRALAVALQNTLNTLECNVRIYVSDVSAYSCSRQP